MKVPGFLKLENDSLLFDNNEGEFVFYVPEYYFERGYAVMYGDMISLIGVLDYAIFDKNGKHSGLKPFRFPTLFLTYPGETEKIKNVKLTKTSETQDYRLLKYKKGDQIVVQTKVPQNIGTAEEFYKMFTSGKLPTTIRYDVLHEYFIDNIELCGSKYGLNMQIFGIVIGEMCRNPNNVKEPFRVTQMKDMTAYKPVNISEIPRYVSPYTAVTSENWDESLTNAMTNNTPKNSPLERLFMD